MYIMHGIICDIKCCNYDRYIMIQGHHITYEPEWVVGVNGQWHRSLTVLQRMKSTEENYAKAIDLLHAVMYEVNRMRQELDTTDDE